MAQQTINIGTVANDSTGDPLRSAFSKVNANFSELYAGRYLQLQFGAAGYSPPDGTTVYVGGKISQSPRTVATQAELEVPLSGTVVKWWVDAFVNAGGSSEAVNFYLRHNNTSDFGNMTDAWDATYTNVTSSDFSYAVAAGDKLTVKIVHPTWASNPTTVSVYGWILFKIA